MTTWARKRPCRHCKQDPVFVRSIQGPMSLEHYRVQCMTCGRATVEYLTMTVAWMDWEDGIVSEPL